MFKRTLMTVFVLMLVAFHAHAQENGVKLEWINGFVVAYDQIEGTTPCFRSCERYFIVRVDSEEVRYIRVGVKVKESQYFPRELIAKKRLWRFKVMRTPTLDEPVYEFIIQNATEFAAEKKYFIWKLIPGAEGEKLPFNESIASYLTTSNGFKAILRKE
ncbi:MAG TPA: hypothetical protein VJP89_04215 [Pyrinomonadaceae bacterium]|nr:hypothetical protein [Pyrinomonadaceae bacterium]